MDNNNFRLNEAESRFEMDTQSGLALIDFTRMGDIMELTHTEVPKELQGQGIGDEIVGNALSYIKSNNLKAAPLCSFVEAYISRHPQWDSIVTNGY